MIQGIKVPSNLTTEVVARSIPLTNALQMARERNQTEKMELMNDKYPKQLLFLYFITNITMNVEVLFLILTTDLVIYKRFSTK